MGLYPFRLFFYLTFQTKGFISYLFNRSQKWSNSEISFVLFSTLAGLELALKESIVIGPSPFILFLALITSSIIVWLATKYFIPWLLWIFGKIWKGKGTVVQFRTVISLALIPNIILEILSVYYEILNLKFDLIILDTPQIFILIFSLIYFRVLVVGIAKIQQFTFGLSLLNLLLPFGILQLLAFVISRQLY